MGLSAEAAIVADRGASLVARLKALATIVETVSIEEVPIPEAVVDALEDSTLISAAVAMKQVDAVCAALKLLGPRPELASTKMTIVRKLIAAGGGGIPLASLAFSLGDIAAGSTLAARDFAQHIVPRLPAVPDPVVGAWLAWLADQTDAAASAVLRHILARGTELDRMLAHANPSHDSRLRSLARGILAS